jgi:hypothetical protein
MPVFFLSFLAKILISGFISVFEVEGEVELLPAFGGLRRIPFSNDTEGIL